MIDVTGLKERRLPPSEVPSLTGAGVYAYYLVEQRSLPRVTSGEDGIIYVGMTDQGLDARNHVSHANSGFSTFRRSLGAILKEELQLTAMPRSKGASKTNTRCYRFHEQGEQALSRWMVANLLCAQVELDQYIPRSEASLIVTLQPPLNLTGWPNPQAAYIKALRAACVREAEQHHSAHALRRAGVRT